MGKELYIWFSANIYISLIAGIGLFIGFIFLGIFLLRKKKKHSPINLFHIQHDEEIIQDWEGDLRRLAISHREVKRKKYSFFLSNFNRVLYNKINRIRFSISKMSAGIITVIPSARWLFDNFQMIYREVKKIKATGRDYLALPVLLSTEYRGYPRIYVLAKKMVDISGAYLDEERIIKMVKIYQEEQPLSDRELHALSEMIALCLLERVIEVARAITLKTEIKYQAEKYVREKTNKQKNDLNILPFLVPLTETCGQDISYHCHVIYLLQNMSFSDEDIQKYIDFHCGDAGIYSHPSIIFKEEGKIESALESSIRTPIVSLREVSQIDEETIFEELSLIEQVLLKDPAEVYPAMSPESRALYRAVIEKLARKKQKTETYLSELCVSLAKKGSSFLNNSHHVGTYLVGKGRPLFLAKIKNKPKKELKEKTRALPLLIFFGLLFLVFSAFVGGFVFLLKGQGIQSLKISFFLVFLASPIFIDLSLLLLNNILTRLVPTKQLPAMDYSELVPDTARTMVVMPVIVSSKEQGLRYMANLHKHYLANRQDNLFFALLLDYADSKNEEESSDIEIRDALIEKLNRLNAEYPHTYMRFSLFIRKRLWNPAERAFMGWERKRGKIEEFNALLNGHKPEDSSYTTLLCDKKILETTKYVITLDADSDLVKDSAVTLVGIIDHPLNRATVDPKTKKIREGYAIVQPSVRNHILEKDAGLFPKIYKGQSGLANYSLLISDVYQDLFQEGTFVGKGIYNAKLFHGLLYKAFPENRILSHDLLESCYAKTAFVSTVNLLENFPKNYLSYAQREHRWIRGDWQLIPFLFKRRLGFLSKWKIFDTMRASLVPMAKILFVFINIFYFPAHWYLWLLVFIFPTCFNLLVLVAKTFVHKIRKPRLAIVFSDFWDEFFIYLQRAFFDIVFLPAKAIRSLDAILKTLYRLVFSKKNLLMWNPADQAERSVQNSLKNYIRKMWTSSLIAFALFVALYFFPLPLFALIPYGLLGLFWLLSPFSAYFISQARKSKQAEFRIKNERELREYARRIWAFFRAFSGKDYNWLCPDSHQITKKEKTIYTTSPTNIGLQMLSVLSARDFGFETLSFLLEYLENVLYAVSFLPKWEGHLFNWYNTEDLTVLNLSYLTGITRKI